MKRAADFGDISPNAKKQKAGLSGFLQDICRYVPIFNNWLTLFSNSETLSESNEAPKELASDSEFPEANPEQNPGPEPPYQPYIHGTNTAILGLLNKTHFLLLSSIDMLERFGLAPMCGELFGGGLDTLPTRCNPCFGKLGSGGDYDLEDIIRYAMAINDNYALFDVSQLNKGFADASLGFFSTLNQSLVLLARIKQAGLFTPALHEKSLVMQKQLRGYIQYCYFQLLLGKYFDLDLGSLEALLQHYPPQFSSPLKEPFPMEAILEKFCNLNFDVKDILDNPSLEMLSQIPPIFHIPANDEKKTPAFYPVVIKKDSTQANKLLIGAVHYSGSFCSRWSIYGASNFNYLTRDYVSFERNKYNRRAILKKMEPPNYQLEEEAFLLEYIDEATRRAKILNDILMKNSEESKLTEEQWRFIKNQFPIILICKNGNLERIKSEYRSLEPLQFGKDIKAIATDTDEHRLRLMRYFDSHHIFNIKVFLIDDLKKSKETQREPLSPYAHKDSFPKLSWLAAKKLPSDTTPPHNCPSVSKMMKAANYYHEENLKRRKVLST